MSERSGLSPEGPARPPAAHRRRLARELRETRHHLSAAGCIRPVEQDLARSYAKNALKSWPYYLLLIVALTSTACQWRPFESLLPGAAILVVATCGIGFASRRFLLLDEPGASLRTWRLGFLLGDLVLGAGWLSILLPFITLSPVAPEGEQAHGFVLVASLVVMGATAILRAPLPASARAGTAPLMIVVLLCIGHGDATGDSVLALLVLSFQLFILYFAGRLHRAAETTFRTRAAFRASTAELEQLRANSAHARQRAEEAERAKTQFLATVGHELRTPLNAILGFSEVMKNEVLGSHSTPSYREYSSDIHGSGQHLLALINEILELSRIESGRYSLAEEAVSIEAILREAVATVEAQADARNQTIVIVADPSLDRLWADPRALRQIALNLLSNAVKFTPPGGHIAVKAGWTSLGGQYMSVADDGPGIPEEEIPIALSSFGRGTLAVTMAAQGAGLGLPIAKGLADLHGGRFVLTSKPRAGTEAAVVFPASRCRPAAPAASASSAAA